HLYFSFAIFCRPELYQQQFRPVRLRCFGEEKRDKIFEQDWRTSKTSSGSSSRLRWSATKRQVLSNGLRGQVGFSTYFSGVPTLQTRLGLMVQACSWVTCSPSWAALFLTNSTCCWWFLRS